MKNNTLKRDYHTLRQIYHFTRIYRPNLKSFISYFILLPFCCFIRALLTQLELIFSEKISAIESLYLIAKDTVNHAVKMHIDAMPPPVSSFPRAFHHIKEKHNKQIKKSPLDMAGKNSKVGRIYENFRAQYFNNF